MSWSAAINAAGAVAGTAVSASSTGKLNKKNRQWQEDRMREQNEYNAPQQQMARLRQAGVNPHLAYQQGSINNVSASPGNPTTYQPDFSGIGDAAQNYVATRQQQTQIKQMEKNMEVADAEISLKKAQELNVNNDSEGKGINNSQLVDLYQLKKDQLAANLNQTNVNTTLAETSIEKQIQDISASKTGQKLSEKQIQNLTQTIAESKQRIKQMVIDGNLKGQEIELKRLELNLRKEGVNPNDPAWMRILTQQVNGEGGVVETIKNSGSKAGKWIKDKYDKLPSVKDWFTK